MKDHLLGAMNCSHIAYPYRQIYATRKPGTGERVFEDKRWALGMADMEEQHNRVAEGATKLEF